MSVFEITAPGEYRAENGQKVIISEVTGDFAFGRHGGTPYRWERRTGWMSFSSTDGYSIIAIWTEPEKPKFERIEINRQGDVGMLNYGWDVGVGSQVVSAVAEPGFSGYVYDQKGTEVISNEPTLWRDHETGELYSGIQRHKDDTIAFPVAWRRKVEG